MGSAVAWGSAAALFWSASADIACWAFLYWQYGPWTRSTGALTLFASLLRTAKALGFELQRELAIGNEPLKGLDLRLLHTERRTGGGGGRGFGNLSARTNSGGWVGGQPRGEKSLNSGEIG
jgi:hypothetical protein